MPDKTVRAKFFCSQVTKRKNWMTGADAPKFVFEYEFQAVTSGSDENKSFFASTPTGTVKLGATRDDLFEPGQEYYLDFTVAPKTE